MSTLEQTPTHSHIRHFFRFKWLWHIIYEDIIEKHFILPRLKEQKEALEKKYNSVKARENDSIINRCRFRVITNEKL
tara:strand:- start:1328 stop:1558 length:231 start_codon:yes stop_codon:yes gene_type:complete